MLYLIQDVFVTRLKIGALTRYRYPYLWLFRPDFWNEQTQAQVRLSFVSQERETLELPEWHRLSQNLLLSAYLAIAPPLGIQQ